MHSTYNVILINRNSTNSQTTFTFLTSNTENKQKLRMVLYYIQQFPNQEAETHRQKINIRGEQFNVRLLLQCVEKMRRCRKDLFEFFQVAV